MVDTRLILCPDCPDHEACMGGAPCSLVQVIERDANRRRDVAVFISDVERLLDVRLLLWQKRLLNRIYISAMAQKETLERRK